MHQSQGKKKDDFWSCSVPVKINLQLTLSYLLWMLIMIDLSTWFVNFSKLVFYYYFSLFSLAFFSDFLYNYAFHIFVVTYFIIQFLLLALNALTFYYFFYLFPSKLSMSFFYFSLSPFSKLFSYVMSTWSEHRTLTIILSLVFTFILSQLYD